MIKLLAGFAAAALFTSTAQAETFVLVHGAFQTGAEWSQTASVLTDVGHTAVVVTLPGRAGDGRALGDITMADHVTLLRATITTATAGDPDGRVVLVGHSFAGLVISAAAEADPTPIATLVYVAAYLPAVDVTPGDTLQDLAMADRHGAWQADSFVVAADHSSASVNPRDRIAIFANDAPAPLGEAIAAAMLDEPLAPLATPVALTKTRFGSVRKAYVVTLRDMAVSTDLQLTLLGRGTVAEAVPLDTGHTPHVTAPDRLAAAILRAATPDIE
jgi:pimeloyl-ACP methyl ester carboxylesterase